MDTERGKENPNKPEREITTMTKTYSTQTWADLYNTYFAADVAKAKKRGGHIVNKIFDLAPCWHEQFAAYLETQGFEVSKYQGMMSLVW